MRNDMRNLMPGDRVLVWDTLNHGPMRPATIVARYGYHSWWQIISGYSFKRANEIYPGGYDLWKYPDLLDVRFDHRPKHISHGHFTSGVVNILSDEQHPTELGEDGYDDWCDQDTAKVLDAVERDFHVS